MARPAGRAVEPGADAAAGASAVPPEPSAAGAACAEAVGASVEGARDTRSPGDEVAGADGAELAASAEVVPTGPDPVGLPADRGVAVEADGEGVAAAGAEAVDARGVGAVPAPAVVDVVEVVAGTVPAAPPPGVPGPTPLAGAPVSGAALVEPTAAEAAARAPPSAAAAPAVGAVRLGTAAGRTSAAGALPVGSAPAAVARRTSAREPGVDSGPSAPGRLVGPAGVEARDRVGTVGAAARSVRARATAVARARRRSSRPPGEGAVAPGVARGELVVCEVPGVRVARPAGGAVDDERPDPSSFPGRDRATDAAEPGGPCGTADTWAERARAPSLEVTMEPAAFTSALTRTRIVSGLRRAGTAPGRRVASSGMRWTMSGRPRGISAACSAARFAARSGAVCAHQRGGETSAPAVERTAIGAAGPARARRTATGRPQPLAIRTDDDATDPIGDGRSRPRRGPGRRMRAATARPSRLLSSGTRTGPGSVLTCPTP